MKKMATETTKRRNVHAERLAELGFSETDIRAAQRIENAGLYDIEPSEDLVERTIARCAAVLSSQKSTVDDVPILSMPNRTLEECAIAVGEVYTSLLRQPAWNECSRLQDFQQACLSTIQFAHVRRESPMVVLDNHNLFNPVWWSEDTGFRAIRGACQIATRVAVESGVSPSIVVAVLRPSVDDYSSSDLEAIQSLLQSCTADLWWIS